MRRRKRIRKGEAGGVLILAMVVLVMLTLVGLMAIETVATEADVVGAERNAENALYIAEAGIQHGLGELAKFGFSHTNPNYAVIDGLPDVEPGSAWSPQQIVVSDDKYHWRQLHAPDLHLPYGEGGFRVVVKRQEPPNQDTLLVRCLGVAGHPETGARRMLEVAVVPGS